MSNTPTTPNADKFITLNQLREKLANRARSSIYLDVENERLPKPMKLGGKLYCMRRLCPIDLASTVNF